MSAIYLVSLFSLLSTITGEPAKPCRKTGERYFLSDRQQCDRFHMCDESGELAAEFLCEDGLVFETISKQCSLPFGSARCELSGRLILQEPQPIGNCIRRNGKWALGDTCNQYIDCSNGVERLVTCQNHLVYDETTGDCEHPDAANREGCTAEELYGFSCPAVVGQARFGAESDCRAFFTCAVYTNYHPRLGGCPVGTVYNDVREICDDPENVPRCRDYYN
eukprot:GFUD01027213.1.p1 GENE.GFUD01027213.1~~GFUD01027213.1.p1  ORF type:complete len:221 (+),score=39.18 GFUD01027213.1:127-789(+)